MASSSSNPTSTSTLSNLKLEVMNKLSNLIKQQDPSTSIFIKSYLLGSLSILPAIIRILINYYKNNNNKTISADKIQLFKSLHRVIIKGLSPTSFASCFAITVGGAKWGESRVEPLVRSLYIQGKLKLNSKGKSPSEGESAEREGLKDEKVIKALSTFVSATISALIGISLLQSSPSYIRRRLNPSLTLEESDQFGASPYPSLTSPDISSPSSSGTSTPRKSSQLNSGSINQSPTLDLTLFVFVRGADTLIRFLYERNLQKKTLKGKKVGILLSFLESQGNTLLFQLSVLRIMWCWFYQPHLLPPSYNRWIQTLSRINPRLLSLLRYARAGEYVYGSKPNEVVALMSSEIARDFGKPIEFVNPFYIKRLDCSIVHGKLGEGSCEVNALKRWIRAFRDALLIYGPVHLIPQLIFNFPNLISSPLTSTLRIILAISRSSAFLATFVASIFASVCLVRTRLPLIIPSLNPQSLDSGLCTGLGVFLCGFSILIENTRRRREMALYCAPRAIYTLMDELVPNLLTRGKTGELLSTLIERSVFAISTGITLSAVVHRSDLVSGVVRGVLGQAVKGWNDDFRFGGKGRRLDE